MALPWLGILDTVIGVANLVRGRKQGSAPLRRLETTRVPGAVESRVTGVVVAALKEVFDRDTQRLELEREHLEAERLRAERALMLELLRQAGDREIGRLRLFAGVAFASWLVTLILATRLMAGGAGSRVTLGVGWLLLLSALAVSFSGQSAVARALVRETTPKDDAATIALWLLVCGLAIVGLAALFA